MIKKKCLDHNDLNNYQPVSNLCFIAKVLEKLILSQLSFYLNSHNLYNTFLLANYPGNSTETAIKVANDLFLSLNKGNISALALLDFLHHINHSILAHRLHTDLEFTDTIPQSISSYLTDQTQYIFLSNRCSVSAPGNS